jgi:hypothetical protein
MEGMGLKDEDPAWGVCRVSNRAGLEALRVSTAVHRASGTSPDAASYTYCISSNNSAIVPSYQWLPTSIQCGEGDRLRPQLIELTIFAPTLLGPSGGVATKLSWASSSPAERKDSALCACPRGRHDNSSTSA